MASLVLYGATAAPGILWGDSGEIQVYMLLDDWLVGGQVCRSHVPYMAVSRLASWLLPMEPARVANLTAALFGALTVANAAWLMARWCRTRMAVVCGSLLLMLSHTLWQMSASAEVLTLSSALMTAEWMAMSRWLAPDRNAADGRRWAITAALVNGLGVATHNMAMLSWPAYAAVWLWRSRRSRHPNAEIGASHAGEFAAAKSPTLPVIAAWLVGASPLLALMASVWRESGNLSATLVSWLFATYAPRVFNISDLPVLGAKSLGYVLMNFPTPLLLLAPAGWRRLGQRVPRAIWVFMCVHGATLVMFVGRYDVADQYTFFVPIVVLVAVATSVGVDGWLAARSASARIIVAVLALVAPIAYATTPALLKNHWPDCPLLPDSVVGTRDRFTWFLQPWRMGDREPEQFARELLRVLPTDVLLVTDTNTFGPINYLQLREGLRRDVRLDLRISRQPWLPPLDDPSPLRQAYLSSGRVYACSDDPRRLPGWLADRIVRFQPYGPVYKVVEVTGRTQ